MIETTAILYRTGTPDKCCKTCYLHEEKLAQGMWCNYFNLQTKHNGLCGLYGSGKSREEEKAEKQNELF
jgi:hypothetical protein